MPMLDFTEDDVFRGLELAKQHGVKPADIDLALTHGEDSQRDALIQALARMAQYQNDFGAFWAFGGCVAGLIAEVKAGHIFARRKRGTRQIRLKMLQTTDRQERFRRPLKKARHSGWPDGSE